ncbi:hypothetical protein [Oleidesulfovibrio sp.]|uniref:hypothetical protein n=1 Tax=Oleidesulfovibrio sp. TaxID=2909707 RepID=UPI003A896F38
MRIHFSTIKLLVAAIGLLMLSACYSPKQGPIPLPDINIGITGFTQPTTTASLLAGYIPEEQQVVDPLVLGSLDKNFAYILSETTTRKFVSSEQGRQCQEIETARQAENPTSAFGYWLNVGRCMNVDYLLIPQLVDWRDRKGKQMTAASPASVTLDLFLMDVQGQTLVSRYHFEETQQTLAENLLNFSKFVERKGKWITAEDLAKEGLYQGIKELGL